MTLPYLAYPEKPLDKTIASLPELGQNQHQHKQQHPTETQNLELTQELKSLRQELVKIKSELNRLSSLSDSQYSKPNMAVWNEAGASSLDEHEEPEVIAERNKLFSEQRRFELEENFTNETVDNNWSEENTETVLAALDSLPAEIHEGVVFNTTQCRSTTCRIEFEYEDEIAQQELEMRLPLLLSENFPGISATHGEHNGVTKSIYFLYSEKI